MKKFAIILAIIMFVSFTSALVLSAITGFKINIAHKNIDEQKVQSIENIKKINIGSLSSEVSITTSDTNEVKAHLYGTTSILGSEDMPTLEVLKNDSNIDIKVVFPNIQIFSWFSYNNIKLDVTIPKAYLEDLDVDTTSGKININDITLNGLSIKNMSGGISTAGANVKSLSAECSSGGIELKNIVSETTKIKSFSGDVRLSGSAGVLTVDKTSGDFEGSSLIAKSTKLSSMSGSSRLEGKLGDLSINSTSGDVKAIYSEFDNDVNITSMSGRITLTLPQNAQFKLRSKAMSGSVSCGFDLTDKNSGHNFLDGVIGTSGKTIAINSTSGDIEIRK